MAKEMDLLEAELSKSTSDPGVELKVEEASFNKTASLFSDLSSNGNDWISSAVNLVNPSFNLVVDAYFVFRSFICAASTMFVLGCEAIRESLLNTSNITPILKRQMLHM